MMNVDVEVASVVSKNERRNEDVFIADADEAIVGSEKEHWNEEIVGTYRKFLLPGRKRYPDLPTRKRRDFRKRAGNFIVQEGKLYYAKTRSSLRLALASKEEQQRAFQERCLLVE